MTTRWVGLTSDTPNKRTVRTALEIMRVDAIPVLLTWRSRVRDAENLNGPWRHVVSVEDFFDPISATTQIDDGLRSLNIHLDNWICIPDSMTDTFLVASEALDVEFPFRRPYSNCRVKPVTRSILRRAGLSNVAFKVCDIDAQSSSGICGTTVCKPITGTGSQGVRMVRSTNELQLYRELMARRQRRAYEVLGYNPTAQFLVEEKLRGTEVEIDGYVTALGDVQVCALGFKHHVWFDGGIREVGGVTYRPYAFPGNRDRELVEWATETLSTLGFRGGCFHIEAMRSDRGLELIEVNPRPGGGGVQPIVEALCGVSLAEECVRLWVGMPPSKRPAETAVRSIVYAIAYADAPGILDTIEETKEISIELDGTHHAAQWFQVASPKALLDLEGEQYLGEIHIRNAMSSETELPVTINRLRDQMDALGLWTVRTD